MAPERTDRLTEFADFTKDSDCFDLRRETGFDRIGTPSVVTLLALSSSQMLRSPRISLESATNHDSESALGEGHDHEVDPDEPIDSPQSDSIDHQLSGLWRRTVPPVRNKVR